MRHAFFFTGCKGRSLFALRIETPEKRDRQTVEPDDLVVVSAPEGGSIEPAIMLAEFVRTHHMPLIVLAKDHPGSKRFSYLVYVGPVITTSCSIRRGTHPEQHLVCSSDEAAGWTMKGVPGGMEISDLPAGINRRFVNYDISIEFS